MAEVIFQDIPENKEYQINREKVIQKCFEVEKINPTPLYICVTFTAPKNIRQANKQYRDIDKETDVLSFPMFEKEELAKNDKNHTLEEWKQDIKMKFARNFWVTLSFLLKE